MLSRNFPESELVQGPEDGSFANGFGGVWLLSLLGEDRAEN